MNDPSHDPRNGPSPVILLWALLPFLLLGVADAIDVRARRAASREHEKVAGWPETDGTVIESSVNTWNRQVSSGSRGSVSRTVTVHGPDVHYRYRVSGVEYRSRGVRPGAPPVDRDRAKAEAVVARYPAGSSVKVRYDPDHPGRSWLENPPPPPPLPFLFVGVNLIVFLLGLYNLGWMALSDLLGARAGRTARALREALPWLPFPAPIGDWAGIRTRAR